MEFRISMLKFWIGLTKRYNQRSNNIETLMKEGKNEAVKTLKSKQNELIFIIIELSLAIEFSGWNISGNPGIITVNVDEVMDYIDNGGQNHE